jgi:uncharacterized protein (TIGR02678 family)
VSGGDLPAVVDAVERQQEEERQRALRALLRHPLLTPSGPDPRAFTVVRRHAAWLREWLAAETGWSLQVETGLARLRKQPAHVADATRPALARPSGAAFGRRRYTLLCLALAALGRADAQVTLGRLAERVLALAGDPALISAGFSFTLSSREERADLVAVVRLLLEMRVVARVAGDEQAFVNATGDALYDVDRRALAGVLVTRRGPSMVAEEGFEERLLALSAEPVPDTDDARNRVYRHALTRRLLDDPVLYLDELDEAQRAYLASQRPFLLRRITEATGFVPEVRGEGIALLDPSGEATDVRMPEEGTEGHAALLLAEHLAGALRARGEVAVPVAELHHVMAGWAREHRSHWKKAAREPGAERGLCRTAVERLEALNLVRLPAEGVVPRPALARFAYLPAVVAGTQETLL